MCLRAVLLNRLQDRLTGVDEVNLINRINDLEFKNSLLSDKLDLDYIEILIREKFLFGKDGETLYIINSNDN